MFNFISRLKNTAIFQGNLNKRGYFEGWYFKQVGNFGNNKLAFIPGISLSGVDDHSFIQVYDGSSGYSKYIKFELEEFLPKKDPFSIEIGNCCFKLTGIEIDIPEMDIVGSLKYSKHSLYKSRWFEHGIMGWYGFVPFLETYHGLISMNHNVDGKMNIGGTDHVFNGGKGYIEKDWGHSFPSSWIWMQSNSFSKTRTSLMVSVAVIPWLRSSFVGHIAVLLIDDEIINFSTYRGGKITSLVYREDGVSLIVETGIYSLKINAIRGDSAVLHSPLKGEMKGRTIESLSGILEVSLICKKGDKQVFSDIGQNAGLEIMDENKDLGRRLGFKSVSDA
ncbi:hypothetical protein GF319_01220 [Candidatus Bathyarchaeota archaeon]|nr:hypothetical protein [Candidatus Bathyarchaeota archaeon]